MSIKYLLPDAVIQYIHEHKLFNFQPRKRYALVASPVHTRLIPAAVRTCN